MVMINHHRPPQWLAIDNNKWSTIGMFNGNGSGGTSASVNDIVAIEQTVM
jgi:hypothetical protein